MLEYRVTAHRIDSHGSEATANPEFDLDELTQIYITRGGEPDVDREVAAR
jgi:hypothetical protein